MYIWLQMCILPVDDSINEPPADENFLLLPHSNCNSHFPTTLLSSGLPVGLFVWLSLCAITNRNAEIYLSVWAGVSWQVRCLSLLFSGSRFAKQTVKIARTCHVLVAASTARGGRRVGERGECSWKIAFSRFVCLAFLPLHFPLSLPPPSAFHFHAPFLNVHLSGSKIV